MAAARCWLCSARLIRSRQTDSRLLAGNRSWTRCSRRRAVLIIELASSECEDTALLLQHARKMSIPQQVVDRGLRPRPLVDALDDDCAGEARTRRAVLAGRPRKRARHHHRIGRHLALERLAGGAIDDAR